MATERQVISISPEGGTQFNARFNPTEYTVAKANQIAEAGVPGLEAPILQYIHGNTRTLDMDLYFDTYEEGTDVRNLTNNVYNLLLIDADTHAPPICDIAWGGFQFRGVLDHVSGKFTLFLSDGTPVRATLSVSFKEFIDVDALVRVQPTQSADHRKQRVVKSGDRLDNIAAEEYGDPGKWRPIAEANSMDDPDQLVPGHVLIIPALV
jgi:Contractile injection system tube protein/LysM domain